MRSMQVSLLAFGKTSGVLLLWLLGSCSVAASIASAASVHRWLRKVQKQSGEAADLCQGAGPGKHRVEWISPKFLKYVCWCKASLYTRMSFGVSGETVGGRGKGNQAPLLGPSSVSIVHVGWGHVGARCRGTLYIKTGPPGNGSISAARVEDALFRQMSSLWLIGCPKRKHDIFFFFWGGGRCKTNEPIVTIRLFAFLCWFRHPCSLEPLC